VDFFYEEGAGGAFRPTVRNIRVEDVTCRKANYALYLRGYESSPIRDVYLSRCTLDGVAKGNVVENVSNVRLEKVTMNGAPLEKM
jgi:hypothetical protein